MNQQLRNITAVNVPRSSSSPPKSGGFDAKVVTVHDGDTCDLVFVKNGYFRRYKTRLLGINSPELGTGRRALKARDFLAWLCVGRDPSKFPSQTPPWSEGQLQSLLNSKHKVIFAEFHGLGGYRRPLVTLKSQPGASKSFNQLLMEHCYADRYRR